LILDFGLENSKQKLRLSGQEFAKRIFAKFGTNNVFEIAEKASIKIVYEKWFPTTIGEFDRKNNTINVNLNACEKVEKIISHELGHFFARDLNLSQAEEEKFCDDFAECLLENQF
jgi:Zn-dependent peptidase ImmA (M78 family)